MRLSLTLLLFLMFPVLVEAQSQEAAGEPQVNVMPLPAKVQLGTGRLLIDHSFSVAVGGAKDARLERAVERFLTNLSRQTGIPFDPAGTRSQPATLTVQADRTAQTVPEFGEAEGYTLDVTPSGATLTAPDGLGVLHGLETLLELVEATPDGFAAPAVHIEDEPRFAWRGLMIDVSRHLIPLDVIRRNIDAMAAVKLNVLHLHLSDDQGFRVQSKKFPKLQEFGSDGLYFTQDQIRDLIDYAADRGIRVVPEFDMPGHTSAWFVGYPELSSGRGPYAVERKWGVFDPTMDPTREETYKFLDKFIGEMSDLFPDRYFHIGGDEVNGTQWNANPNIQAFMRAHEIKNNHELQQYFTERVQRIIARHHKIMVGWDEILSPGMSKDIVIQSWRGQASLAAAAKQGYSGLLSSGYYLDAMLSAAQHYGVDPTSGDAASLSNDEKARILGGETCAWAEFLTPQNFDSRLWPRAAAIAERLWSPEQTQDVPGMYRRLAAVSWRLEFLGLTHKSNLLASLGRMSDTGDVARLRVLADAVRPVGLGIREQLARAAGLTYTSATPLNHLTDVAPPESESADDFTTLVNALAASGFKNAAAESEIRDRLILWRDNDAVLETQLGDSALLADLGPVSQALASLGAAGLQALDYLDKGEKAPDAWRTQTLSMIEQTNQPMANLFIAIAPAVEALVQASAGATPPAAATH
ncbi:MAG TPA: family 20 glycosylhydrolase [Candidatus Cybelea sp.]|nr:family 20 glycosylhydrolase [Candidatus Cybelea sp.]